MTGEESCEQCVLCLFCSQAEGQIIMNDMPLHSALAREMKHREARKLMRGNSFRCLTGHTGVREEKYLCRRPEPALASIIKSLV